MKIFAAGQNLTGVRYLTGRTPVMTLGPPSALPGRIKNPFPVKEVFLDCEARTITPKVFANSSPGLSFGNPGTGCNPERVRRRCDQHDVANPFRVEANMTRTLSPGFQS